MAEDDIRDWHLREWAELLGKRQGDLVRERGWLKGRANKFWHGYHSYRREVVNELADWLGIEPYELLMPPAEAMALRRLRQAAAQIAAERPADAAPEAVNDRPKRTGTRG